MLLEAWHVIPMNMLVIIISGMPICFIRICDRSTQETLERNMPHKILFCITTDDGQDKIELSHKYIQEMWLVLRISVYQGFSDIFLKVSIVGTAILLIISSSGFPHNDLEGETSCHDWFRPCLRDSSDGVICLNSIKCKKVYLHRYNMFKNGQ